MLFTQIKRDIQKLFPAYFALVMATGIIGISANSIGYVPVSKIMFFINNIEFVLLLILYFLRLFFYFYDFTNDLKSDEKGIGFLTIVAASGVLGVQYILLKHEYLTASVLWIFSIAVWAIIMVFFFLFSTTKSEKPTLGEAINGIWLLLVVSTQSIAVLGNELIPYFGSSLDKILFFTFSFFLLGISLYFTLITLIFYRLVFFSIRSLDILHPYWINTGAASISTLSGCILAEKILQTGAFMDTYPFVKGFTMFMWITGTWWIPITLAMEIWHYVVKRLPWKYDPRQWSMVFAIGMYSIATWRLSGLVNISSLKPVAIGFFFFALVLWIITFLAMCRRLLQSIFSSARI